MTETTEWRNRIVGEGEQPASQFIANPANWRVHGQNQRDAMRGALNEVGWVQRVIVNRQTGYLVDGHERVWQALQNGDAPVPYVEVDLSPEEEAYVLATLDPLSAMAAADKEQLDALLREVQTGEAGVQAMLDQLAQDAGVVPPNVEFPEYDEDVADSVEYITCPKCGAQVAQVDYPAILAEAWAQHLAPRAPDAPTVISTFAGCGGSSLGYSMAGYRELLAVEWDNNAVETFRLNFPEVPVYHGDIAKLTVDECLRLASFPDAMEMVGDFKDKWARIGNSVPPLFMRAIARHLRERVL